jgi:hypothetical protein
MTKDCTAKSVAIQEEKKSDIMKEMYTTMVM